MFISCCKCGFSKRSKKCENLKTENLDIDSSLATTNPQKSEISDNTENNVIEDTSKFNASQNVVDEIVNETDNDKKSNSNNISNDSNNQNENDTNSNLIVNTATTTTTAFDNHSTDTNQTATNEKLPRKSSLKKRVNINEQNNELFTTPSNGGYLLNVDDDDVFSDAIPSPIPRGDMCTLYPRKRTSLPGLELPDWFNAEIDHSDLQGPPNTPIGKDELAMKRHRFFSDLLHTTKMNDHHRVRFNPFGPIIAENCSHGLEPLQSEASDQFFHRLENLLDRLEKVVVLYELHTKNLCKDQIDSEEIPDVIEPEVLNKEIVTMSVRGYEDIILGYLNPFLELSRKIGGDVATQSEFVKKAFDAQFEFVKYAAASAAPSQSEQMQLLKPTSDQITAIQNLRDKNRTSPFFNHLTAISESISALGWVCVSPTPGPHVKEMNDAGQFYTNRVLKDWKEKDQTHVEWTRAWVSTLNELQKYIKQYHTTGLVWSGKKTGGPPPPPPGPPPPPVAPIADLSLGDSGDERSALFAQINQGADITKSLKKVTSDMQTHKNSQLRSGPAPYVTPQPFKPTVAAKPTVLKPADVKPPVFSRDGKKWLIEYQKSNNDLKVDNAEMNNVVYMFKSENSTLTVTGKINSIVVDSCKKCSVLFDSLVSSIEFVNCQSVQMQALGKVPTISIDKTDGCQMYLSQDSLAVEIVSSKSSEMNVLIPTASGDYTEQPIPEQFKTTIKGKSLSTTCVESLG